MSKTLTEKWYDGELPLGNYYIKVKLQGEEKIIEHEISGSAFFYDTNVVLEILAPVPSYDHFSQLVKKVECLQKKLEIATKALKGVCVWANTGNGGEEAVKKVCEKALKEMESVK